MDACLFEILETLQQLLWGNSELLSWLLYLQHVRMFIIVLKIATNQHASCSLSERVCGGGYRVQYTQVESGGAIQVKLDRTI